MPNLVAPLDLPVSARTRVAWSTIIVGLVAVLGVTGVCGALYLREADVIAKNTLDREARRTEIFAHFFEQDIQSLTKDLRQLSDGDGLQAFLMSGQQSDLDRAIRRARFFSQMDPDYDQLRYLNEEGQEIIRINANGVVVPPGQLQNKADRPYFQKAFALGPGQFFISAFDLNVERGQIEQPLKPMLRGAEPVFDATGRKRGIYIINYLGENSLARLEKFSPQFQQRLRMLNAQGYWLKASQPDQEWGFMFPDRSGLTLAQTDPGLWRQISSKPTGQILQNGGVFTWSRIVPREILSDKPGTVAAEEDYLVMAAEISPAEWTAYFTELRQTFFIVALVLWMLLVVSLWFFRSRQQAQRERDRFFTLTRDMLCVAGFDGYFKRVNPAWETTLGYTEDEMLAKPFIDFVHPEDREKTRSESKRLTQGGEVVSFENRYLSKDGTYRWLLWSARALVHEQLIFASARDQTERKQVEEQILSLNSELKKRADDLETANKELEAFSYSVSHDLRAPLRHIHGFVELLQKAPALQADESSLRQMRIIAKAAREMGLLIDDLIAFSRTSRAEMHPMQVDMRDLIDQVIHDLQLECQGRKLVWDIRPLPPADGDPSLLRLVWMNLIGNAIKYTRPREQATIEIGQIAEDADKTGKYNRVFYIRDNGVGFDMQYASKLFGVFQRLHRAEDFEGTGIGLANVQRIIHRHGGRVWAESKVDSGAVFYFSLPIVSNQKNNHVQN